MIYAVVALVCTVGGFAVGWVARSFVFLYDGDCADPTHGGDQEEP
jgi:hypothetical protein